MAESPTKKTKTEHQPEKLVTATSVWDGLRVAAEGKEQSLIGALDEDGELGWLEDERDESVAHFARKPWLAAMLHDSERNRAYARALNKQRGRAGGCVALEIGAGTGLLTQLLCKEDRIVPRGRVRDGARAVKRRRRASAPEGLRRTDARRECAVRRCSLVVGDSA